MLFKTLRLRLKLLSLGIALSVCVVMLVLSLSLGIRTIALKQFVQQLPIDTIEIMPSALNLGLFQLKTATLDDKTFEQVKHLPHVQKAFPKYSVPLPLGARGGARLFGKSLHTDLLMTAVPSELIREDNPEYKEQDTIQVFISEQLIDIYNTSVASLLHTPQLTVQTLKGFAFEMVVGKSLMLGSTGARMAASEPAFLAGTSRYAMRLGVTVSLETAERLMQQYATQTTLPYAAILLKVEHPKYVPEIVQQLKHMNLAVNQTAEHASVFIRYAMLLLICLSCFILLLAAFAIAQSFYAELALRQHELGILRAMGLKRSTLIALVVLHAIVIGCMGSLIGFVATAGLLWLAMLGLQTLHIPFIFMAPWWLWLWVFSAAVVFAILGAVIPAFKVTRLSITQALEH